MIIIYQSQATYDAVLEDLSLAPDVLTEEWEPIVTHIQHDTHVAHGSDGRIAQFCVLSDPEEQWLRMYIDGLEESGIIPTGAVSLMESMPTDWQWNSTLTH